MPRNPAPAPVRPGTVDLFAREPAQDARQAEFFEPMPLRPARRALRRVIILVGILGFLFAAALPFLI